ncbi:alkaline phosphatase family protein [Phenylobacterium sp. 20VBR1]|uniref:Alkaline phosphatase family protein n=1 Tax=Phenylobacterium glaciei TaxID=2803784 RepID=A0A941D130_9CAUL|nr:alkaline phosphatase family protein [Phenylobacterium glaciei]MBR7618928.1 alkaline phosphatase family protein [Phenylobacterium glaciei]
MTLPRALIAALALALAATAPALAKPAEERLVLVTVDGLSWQELFHGADPARAADKTFVEDPAALKPQFIDVPDRARALTPFLHDVVAKQGVLLGDRDHGGCVRVTNDMWFSYPGYNEILTGRVDPAITSNEHGQNKNVTVLEWLNGQPGFQGKVRAVTSWNTFDDILAASRSKLAVNAGWATSASRTPMEATLARLQAQTPRRWAGVRFDLFTHGYALETLKHDKPRVLYVSYGETDDFAHDGLYDQTLIAARRTDAFIGELWAALQADPAYAGKTTLIVTTDHGRGTDARPEAWKSHGKPAWPGSDETWIAAIGPSIAPQVTPTKDCLGANQVAATGLKSLGLDWTAFDPAAGPPLAIFKAAGRVSQP